MNIENLKAFVSGKFEMSIYQQGLAKQELENVIKFIEHVEKNKDTIFITILKLRDGNIIIVNSKNCDWLELVDGEVEKSQEYNIKMWETIILK